MLTTHMLSLRVNVVMVGGLIHVYINLFNLVKQDASLWLCNRRELCEGGGICV